MDKMFESRLFINNEFVDAKDGKTFPVINPYTGKIIAQAAEAGLDDIDSAVEVASNAWRPWSEMYAAQRASHLRALADSIRANWEEIALIESATMGIPFRQFWFDREVCCACLTYFASLCETLGGETSLNTPGVLSFSIRQPFGVTAAIIPWNAPLIFFAFKIGASVAAGNAIIMKTSEKAPLSCLFVAKLAKEVGFPPGLINIISGMGPTTGAALAAHMRIRKISFTGSARTGKLVQKAAVDSNLKAVTLELGGKSPTIVFDDADLDVAAADLARSFAMTSGQVCMASTRVYVHDSVYTAFLAKLQACLAPFLDSPGDPTDAATVRGPIVDIIQFESVKAFLEQGAKSGKVVFGGKTGEAAGGRLFIQPTIIEEAEEDSQIVKQEAFGPILCMSRFTDEGEAVARSNDSEYGLYASVYTKDISRAMRVAKQLEAGSVGINANAPTLAADMPYGGWKGSGTGRELGPDALHHWTEVKAIFMAA